MAKALKCDKCGQFYDLLSEQRRYLIEDSEKKWKTFVDLCPDCYEYFIKWLSNEKEEQNV